MKKIIAFLTAAIILVVGFNIAKKMNEDEKQRRLYENYPMPEKYSDIIKVNSIQYQVPTELIYGVIHTESSFIENATSYAGAMGLMQLTEDTFIWLQSKTNEKLDTSELYTPEINIKYGVFFLKLLYDEYGNWDTALAAYNAGRGNVNKWLSDESITQNGILVNIPFEETKNYITKVNNAKEMYISLYFQTNGETTEK